MRGRRRRPRAAPGLRDPPVGCAAGLTTIGTVTGRLGESGWSEWTSVISGCVDVGFLAVLRGAEPMEAEPVGATVARVSR